MPRGSPKDTGIRDRVRPADNHYDSLLDRSKLWRSRRISNGNRKPHCKNPVTERTPQSATGPERLPAGTRGPRVATTSDDGKLTIIRYQLSCSPNSARTKASGPTSDNTVMSYRKSARRAIERIHQNPNAIRPTTIHALLVSRISASVRSITWKPRAQTQRVAAKNATSDYRAIRILLAIQATGPNRAYTGRTISVLDSLRSIDSLVRSLCVLIRDNNRCDFLRCPTLPHQN